MNVIAGWHIKLRIILIELSSHSILCCRFVGSTMTLYKNYPTTF